jgi:hypothetical protein
MSDIVIFTSSGVSHDFILPIRTNLLKNGFKVETWKKNVFKPGNSTINCITDRLKNSDFAIVVLSKDDILVKDKSVYEAPRDNVVLELGLCIGILGLPRTIYLFDQSRHLKIPSDLDGITGIPYDISAGVKQTKSICSEIRKRVIELGPKVKSDKLPDFRPYVEIYHHKHTFTKLQAETIKKILAADGVNCSIKNHIKGQNPDAIFIGVCVPAYYVRLVLNLLPYHVTHIFKMNYPDSEGGDSNGFKIGIGFSSTYNQYKALPESQPVPISHKQFRKITSKRLSNVELYCFLADLTLK